jgi:hypothetical protein
MNELSERYLEDFAVGQTFGSRWLRIDRERALAFAAEFDPQPFHLDEAAARRSIFGGLSVSGWYTAAVTMRLLVGPDQAPNDHPEPERRARAGACREPDRAAAGGRTFGRSKDTFRSCDLLLALERGAKARVKH